MSARGSGTSWLGIAIVIVVVLAGAWWYYTRPSTSTRAPAMPTAPAPASSAGSSIQHPIGAAQAVPAPGSTAPLPPLTDSDAAVADALSALPGASGLRDLLIAQGLIPHIVAAVDALPRRSIGASILPLHTPPGKFAVTALANGQFATDPANYSRYDAYLRIAQDVDARTLVGWYVHWYPLFQQAYQELGYPHGYFNDRLVAAIDDMLATPDVRSLPSLQAGQHGLYEFADPTLEALSVGQKLMIRMGPENEARLKAKLREVRAALLGQLPGRGEHMPSGTSVATAATS